MKNVSIVAMILLLVGCASGTPAPRSELREDPGALLFNGYAKSEVTCFACHRGDGTGTSRGPSLVERVPKLGDDALLAAIDSGPGFMPSFKRAMTDAEKRQLVAWLRARFG